MYAHGGSGNHGCEAIVRATAAMLDGHDGVLLSAAPEEDVRYGVNALCEVTKDTEKYNKASPRFLAAYAALKLRRDHRPMDILPFALATKTVKKGDVALSVGGDNYCYADREKYIMQHGVMRGRGAKTVLWGCSVEPELLNDPTVAKDIAAYDLITARESISYAALKRVNPNTVLVTDPAFTLRTESVALPGGFAVGNTVGINLSPLVLKAESADGVVLDSYIRLCRYILDSTDMSIAFIPHVVWDGNDDRLPLAKLCAALGDGDRTVQIDDMSCERLKGVIAACRFFVGARTHATIAAYSSLVPTLAIGYSVKARGIARDIFGNEDGLVLPVGDIRDGSAVTEAFKGLVRNEAQIKARLESVMPTHKAKALSAADRVKELMP